MLLPITFPHQPMSTLNTVSCNRGDSDTVLAVLQQTHIDAMEVDTPVGSGPGRNITIAVLAGWRQGGACGCQSAHRSYGFLHHDQKRRKGFIDWEPKPRCDNLKTEQEDYSAGRWFAALTTEGCDQESPAIWPLRSCYHSALWHWQVKRGPVCFNCWCFQTIRATPSSALIRFSAS